MFRLSRHGMSPKCLNMNFHTICVVIALHGTGFQISLIFQWKPIFQLALASGMENMGAKHVQESDLLIWVQNIFRNLTY